MTSDTVVPAGALRCCPLDHAGTDTPVSEGRPSSADDSPPGIAGRPGPQGHASRSRIAAADIAFCTAKLGDELVGHVMHSSWVRTAERGDQPPFGD
jgi:hypothetical protein